MDFLTIVSIVVLFVALRALWWWFVGRKIPKYPPLAIDFDDPAMTAAQKKARASLDRFRALFEAGMTEAQVKVPFVTSSGQVEHLWAQVLKLNDEWLVVRYLTPPASHSAKLERMREHPISDIEDWVVVAQNGDIHGGYTRRVMFERGREAWGRLPRELEKQASRYVAE
jgi:uncharacterized protein YegJ (DUF2314 family)